MRRRSLAFLAAVVVIAGGPAAAVSAVAPVPAGAASSTQASTTSPIKHVIVVMQSGHSFDSYFGTRHGVSGIPSGVCLTLVANTPGCIKPYHLDPDQSRAGLSDTLGVTQRSINGGKMDGFARAQPNASIGATSMGYLTGQDLPYYWNLADRFTLYDQFFATSRAGALPNRVAAVAGQDGGLTGGTVPAAGITTPTVFDQLDHAGLSWKYYVENYKGAQQPAVAGQQSEAPVVAMPAITGDPARASHIVDTNQYFDDLLDGNLPAVSYVAGTVDSERSPLDPTLGEFFVKSLTNALMQSSAWKDTVLLLTYDSSGGWYDNVSPPVMGGVPQGIRVPMLMVSPFARAGVVDHSTLNTTAIPGMIDQVFGLPVLTPQTAAAGNLLSGVDLKRAPIAPLIAPLPGGATVAVRPDVLVVYGLYLLMFLATGLLASLAFRRYRRSKAAPDSWPELGAVVSPTDEDIGPGEDPKPTTEHGRPTPAVRATFLTDKAVELFRVPDVANPHERGTPEHDAWQSGHDDFAMSIGTEAEHTRASADCLRMAGQLREAGSGIEAASYFGMAAAHTEACTNLTAAKRINSKTFSDDTEFSPVARNGQKLSGSKRTRYVQGYARGRTESAQVDDPSTYLDLAIAATEAVPQDRHVDFALARGRADGASRTLADRRGQERAPVAGDSEMQPAHAGPVTASEADRGAPSAPARTR